MTEQASNHPIQTTAALHKLEFDKVVERICELTVSESGRHLAARLAPRVDRTDIESELLKVSEAKELLIGEGSLPLTSFKNILPALKKTAVENQVLSVVELAEIAETIRISRTLRAFLAKHAVQTPRIGAYHAQLYAEKLVEHHINEAIDDRGMVRDSASRELREIRRSLIAASEALLKKLETILRDVSDKELLREEIITTRDGRFVIPVKTEYKYRVPGFIHSTSGSGATVFVEPAESLELNNGLRELQIREQREIHRILADLTRQVQEIRAPLELSFSTLTELDVIVARARYSVEIIGFPPALSRLPGFHLVRARHPILLRHMKREEVVPLTMELGGDPRTLLITGPNAGGKTVTMKTAGLLTACAQAGIHIPADPESEIYPFKRLFVDIGDDQSIENDLSTFSSHLLFLRTVLEQANEESLVLIDEIGAGTDPAEGGALAAVVLEELTRRGGATIATTHHGTLKAFAHKTPGMANASMEFDQESLKPTYRFRSGMPGSSYAFELAERLGIRRSVIESARLQVGDEKSRLEALLLVNRKPVHTEGIGQQNHEGKQNDHQREISDHGEHMLQGHGV